MGTDATSGREQIDNMQEAIGFDGYNGVTTGDKEATLGINCGLTTGRNGVLVKKVIGVDLYNQSLTGVVSKTLNSIATDSDHIPCVLIKKEQPIYTLKIRGGCEGGGKGALIQTDKSATLGTCNDQCMFVPIKHSGGGHKCYSVDEKMGNTYVWEEQANTLASRDYKMPQAVLVKNESKQT